VTGSEPVEYRGQVPPRAVVLPGVRQKEFPAGAYGLQCALIVGDDTVHVIACDTRTTAQWRIDGQQLINAADGECLTEPSTGTAVKVTTCDGSAGQRWSLP